MNVLVVEKEKTEARKLVSILRMADPSINIVKTVENLSKLQHWISNNPWPDIVLINLAKLPFLATKNIHVLAKLVLHTKNENLTYLAFRAAHIAQLQNLGKLPDPKAKGISIGEPMFQQEAIPSSATQVFKKRFFVESGQKFLSVMVDEIAYFYSDGRFVYFITNARNKYIIHYKMSELEQLLDPSHFHRISRSFIVSVNSISQIHPYFGGRFKLKITPSPDEEIIVSRNRAPGFGLWLGE